jgi:hypothetical protein
MEENVNKLFDSEKEAAKIVEAAVLAKTVKMRDAPDYAKGDINKYRQAQKEKYEAIEKSLIADQLNNNTEQSELESAAMLNELSINKKQVIDLLIANVMLVEIDVPRVLRGVDENMEY